MKPTIPAILIAGLLVPAGAAVDATAATAKASSSKPAITRVSPMRIKVGGTLTIRGKNFSSKRTGNKVILRAKNGRSAIGRVRRASRTKLVLSVPAAAERLLTKKPNIVIGTPTRLYLRVVTSRYGKLSSLRHSPVVLSGLRSGKASTKCGKGDDWDNDLLPNSVETKYSLDPCKADTDGDGMSDGWEYWSAKDLNAKAVPYPGKKPFPNPLDSSDGKYDFDGDSLTASIEYKLWVASGSSFEPGRAGNASTDSPLGYSDGTQASRPGETPAVPAFVNAGYKALFPAQLEMRADGKWSDDERDADSDGLNNYVETTGPGRVDWWPRYFAKKETVVQPWPDTYYGPFNLRPFADTEAFDPDVDGDGLLDGEDDQDNDDVPNLTEMYDPTGAWTNGRRKNAFNPCAPDGASRTCPPYQPL